MMKLKRINQTAAALLTAAALAAQPAYSTGIPTFDGGSFMGAIQELMNWQARFQSLIRDGLTKLTGVKQFLDARQEAQIQNMFRNRIAQCERLRKNNAASADLCVNTVRLEQQKYTLLKHMNAEITAEFNQINGMIAKQGELAKKTGGLPAMPSFGGMAGMTASVIPSSPGQAESTEQDVQKQLQGVIAKIQHYEVQLNQIDMTINQLKWARKQLTKDQLAGNQGIAKAITNTTSGLWLQQEVQRISGKTKRKRGENAGISNRF